MKPPSVKELTTPSIHKTTRTRKIVHNMFKPPNRLPSFSTARAIRLRVDSANRPADGFRTHVTCHVLNTATFRGLEPIHSWPPPWTASISALSDRVRCAGLANRRIADREQAAAHRSGSPAHRRRAHGRVDLIWDRLACFLVCSWKGGCRIDTHHEDQTRRSTKDAKIHEECIFSQRRLFFLVDLRGSFVDLRTLRGSSCFLRRPSCFGFVIRSSALRSTDNFA
jgi:hypothetical protein